MATSTYTNPTDVFNNVYDRTLQALRITSSSDVIAIVGDTYTTSETASVGVMESIIFASTDLLSYSTKCITIMNDGANTIDNITVQTSPDDTNWEDYDTATFASLTSGTIKSLQINLDSHKYWRVTASSSNDSSTTVWITANSLLKGSAGESYNIIINETPTGTINGINVTFDTEYSYTSGSTQLYKNGIRMEKDINYVENGGTEIELTAAPIVGDNLKIDYVKA